MPTPEIIAIVRAYLALVVQAGIPARRAVIFGSHARGTGGPESDIDVLVISSQFDSDRFAAEPLLWRLTRRVDPRVEPIPVGETEYSGQAGSPLVDEAKRTGFVVEAA